MREENNNYMYNSRISHCVKNVTLRGQAKMERYGKTGQFK